MSYCTRCGRDVESGLAVCPYCGKDINVGNVAGKKKFNLFSAYTEMFKRYAEFNGRSTRSEYWYVYLIESVLGLIAVVAEFALIGLLVSNYRSVYEVIYSAIYWGAIIYSLVTLIPHIALGVRRLHDTGKSGWFYLLSFIPFVGEIIIIVLMAMDSEKGMNEYGPNPKGE